ncbi:MAG: DNA-binding protein [Clostridia bacterium]|nr:DNA-binding protein [Clostridia bacterium]
MFEKNLRLSVLFDAYGALLTSEQQNMFDLYYNEDLSLAEIAEHTGRSRQGVRYAIKHAEEALINYEEKLGLSRKIDLLQEKLSDAEDIIRTLKAKQPDESNEFDLLLSLVSSAGSIMKE